MLSRIRLAVIFFALLLPLPALAQQYASAQSEYVASLAVAMLRADAEIDSLRAQLGAAQKQVADLTKQLADATKKPDAPK